MTGSNESKAILELAKKEGKSEAEIRTSIEGIWDKVRNAKDPSVRDYWALIDRPWQRPTAEEMMAHIITGYYLCEAVVAERMKVTGRRLKVPSRNRMFYMFVGMQRPNKVVRAAMLAARYIQEEDNKK